MNRTHVSNICSSFSLAHSQLSSELEHHDQIVGISGADKRVSLIDSARIQNAINDAGRGFRLTGTRGKSTLVIGSRHRRFDSS